MLAYKVMGLFFDIFTHTHLDSFFVDPTSLSIPHPSLTFRIFILPQFHTRVMFFGPLPLILLCRLPLPPVKLPPSEHVSAALHFIGLFAPAGVEGRVYLGKGHLPVTTALRDVTSLPSNC